MQEFLDDLKASDPGDFAAIMAGLAKLGHHQNHRAPLSQALGDGLLELRPIGKLNTRLFWFFAPGRRIITVHGIRNKGRDLPSRDSATAHARRREWIERYLS